MASTRDFAIALLPHFEDAVLSGSVHTYGYFAKRIGLDPSSEAIVLGPAMHAIGGVCVLAAVPVAPLHFVQRSDGAWRGVFEKDSSERSHVLPHYDVIYVSARDYGYSQQDFARVARGLAEVVPKDWSPHKIWHHAIYRKPKGASDTYFERALAKYNALVDQLRLARRK